MKKFTHSDWGQRDIINNIIILTRWGEDNIYTVITGGISEVSLNQST